MSAGDDVVDAVIDPEGCWTYTMVIGHPSGRRVVASVVVPEHLHAIDDGEFAELVGMAANGLSTNVARSVDSRQVPF